MIYCENFQYFLTFSKVSGSADGLQIRVNLANPKTRSPVVIIFDSNSSNLWRMIFQDPKKFSKYDSSLKSFSNLKYLLISRISDFQGWEKHKSNLQPNCVKDFNGFALPSCRYNGYLKIQFTMSMLIRQFDVWITS